MLRTRTLLVVVSLLVVAVTPALPIATDELPKLGGTVFAAEIIFSAQPQGAVQRVTAMPAPQPVEKRWVSMWAFEATQLTEYRYDPDTGELSSVGGNTVTELIPGEYWLIEIDGETAPVEAWVNVDGYLNIDGAGTLLQLVTGVSTVLAGFPCHYCLMYHCDECCECCFCFHRCLNVSRKLDRLCCFFSC